MPEDVLPHPLDVPRSARNLADLLAGTAARTPDRVALTHGERTLTWAQWDDAASSVALALLERGLSPGQRVVLVLPTSLEFAQAYLGVLRAGGVAVPLNTGYTVGELARMIGRSEAFAVVAGEPALGRVRQSVAGIADALTGAPDDLAGQTPPTIVTVGDALPGEVAFTDLLTPAPQAPPPPTGDEDPAVLLFTSGASSDPRAAVLSHRALVANLDQVMALDPPPITGDDVLLGVLPLFHVYGLNAVLGQALRTGAAVVLADRFDPQGTLDLVAEKGITVVPVAPPMLVAWSEMDSLPMDSVRYLVSGAAALPVHILEQVEQKAGRPIHQGYGLTEGAPVVTTTLASPHAKPGSVGRPVPGVQVLLADESGQPVDEGDPGEILIRGGNLFSGYFPGQVEGPDADGWWRTGDVAYADPDGDLFLVDRIRDLVIVNGFNVYPREVEEAILEHPAVAEVAVVSVPHPLTGEAVKAVVVAEEGQTVTAEEIGEHCRDRLARFKRPTVVEVVEQLPRTPTGKIAKGRLRQAREDDKRRAGLA